MVDFRSLDGKSRQPTYAERARMEELRAAGVEDVYCEPWSAPDGFWLNLLQASTWLLATPGSHALLEWAREITYAQGWSDFYGTASDAFALIVAEGYMPTGPNYLAQVSIEQRLSAIEHLLDVAGPEPEFNERVNERARWHRVGLRLEGNRFVPITSEHMHTEVVQPSLLLLSDPRFESVDGLYRKAFERALSGDPSGAITAATSAVQEMFRAGLGVAGCNMLELANRARQAGWIIAGVHQFAVKLDTLRGESDAHAPGTDDFDVAMLAIHLAGSLLLHLGKTGPFAPT